MIDKLKNYEQRGLIKSQKHPELDLHIWNYTPEVQYRPELWDDITRMCRGLITDSAGNVVQRPIGKFFNAGERDDEKPYDFEGATIQEKIDGSLGIMYWVDGLPYIASRGSFTSEQAKVGTALVQDAYRVWNRNKYLLREPRMCEVFENPHTYTHLFEIIYPENRIVVDYGFKTKLVYLASVNKFNGVSQIFNVVSFDTAKQYSIQAFQDILLNQPKGHEMEGFVVRFSDDRRLKYKFEDYKRLHYIMTELTDRTIWAWCREGEKLSDHLECVPDELYNNIQNYVDKLKLEFKKLDKSATALYIAALEKPTRKEQAQYIMGECERLEMPKGFSGAVFAMLDNKSHATILWDFLKPDAGRTFLMVGAAQ